MKTTLITITLDHIRKGQPGNLARCPVRFAMQDAGFKVAMATFTDIGWWNGQDQETPTPKKVRRWLEAFDAGKAVKPFNFRLRRPDLVDAPEPVTVGVQI